MKTNLFLRLALCLNITVAVESVAAHSVLFLALNVGMGLIVAGVLVQRREARR